MMSRYRIRNILWRSSLYIALIIVLIVSLFPIYWMFISSIKPHDELYTTTPSLIVKNPTFEYYELIFREGRFQYQLINTLLISLGTAALVAFISLLGGYGFARMNFPGKRSLHRLILSTYVIPSTFLIFPLFFVVLNLKLYDNLLAVVIAVTTTALPFCVSIMRGFILTIPKELEESAMIDGASRWQAILRIIFPLTAPGLAAIATYAFVLGWNAYLEVIIFISTDTKFTLPIGLASIIVTDIIPWGKLLAWSTLYAIPGIIFFSLISKWMVAGITKGAMKY